MMHSIIFVDMDGVLADFMGAAHKVLGKPFDDLSWKNDKGQDYRRTVIREKGYKFWESLVFMHEGKLLWEYVKPYNPHILSAYASWDPHCRPGKHEWLKTHLKIPDNRIHLVKRDEKSNFARNLHTGTPNILIDDYVRNIKEFREAGGIGIHHVGGRSTIVKLQELGYGKHK